MNLGHGQVERAKVKQAKSEHQPLRLPNIKATAAYTAEGMDLIHDDGGIVAFVNANKAREVVRRWNAFPELVAALRAISEGDTMKGREKWSIFEVAEQQTRIASKALRNIETK